MSNIYKLFFLVFIFFINSNSFSQNIDEYERQKVKNESFDYENLEPLYIGNFLSSIVASKNRDYKKFLSFSEKALKSKKMEKLIAKSAQVGIHGKIPHRYWEMPKFERLSEVYIKARRELIATILRADEHPTQDGIKREEPDPCCAKCDEEARWAGGKQQQPTDDTDDTDDLLLLLLLIFIIPFF